MEVTTFHGHLLELRRRIFWSLLWFGIGAGVGYAYSKQLVHLIQLPLNLPLYYSTPSGGFELLIRVSCLAGTALAIPAIIYNLVRFIEPALNTRLSKLQIFRLLTMSLLLVAAGAVFAYEIILPLSLHFFTGFSTHDVKPLISTEAYWNFVVSMLTAFAVFFQLPLIISFIDRFHPLDPGSLGRWRKWVVVLSLLAALVLPFTYDPLSQFVVALPIIILYELSIWMIKWRRRPKKTKILPPVQEFPPAEIVPAPSQISPSLPPAKRPKSPHVIDLRQAQP